MYLYRYFFMEVFEQVIVFQDQNTTFLINNLF